MGDRDEMICGKPTYHDFSHPAGERLDKRHAHHA